MPKVFIVYLDLGYDGVSIDDLKVFRNKHKAENYLVLVQFTEKFGKYFLMEREVI
jgi:hypothetical protein